jgi:nucleoside-diphosphate kinase
MVLMCGGVVSPDSVASADKEIGLWFPEGVTSWDSHSNDWIYE